MGVPTLKQLIDEITWPELLDTLTLRTVQPRHRLHYENLLKRLRLLECQPSRMRIRGEMTPCEDGDYLHICGLDGTINPHTGTEQHWNLTFTAWEQWLSMTVEPSTLLEFSSADVVAACMHDMAWNGTSQKAGREVRQRVFKSPIVFLSHASEDKDSIARPLAHALESLGLTVWFDEFDLSVGDSLRKEIAKAISTASSAVVVLSKPFFKKAWTERELAGIVSMETSKKFRIVPVWHGVTVKEVAAYDPSLADKIGLSTSNLSIEAIALKIEEITRKKSVR